MEPGPGPEPSPAMTAAVEAAVEALALGHYALLGIEVDATQTEIKRAFRTRALNLHPDKNVHPLAEEMFKAATEAFQVLSDAPRRREYDLVLRGICFREEERRMKNSNRWKNGPPPGWGVSPGGSGSGGGGRKKRGKNSSARSRTQAWGNLSDAEKQGWWDLFEDEEDRVRRESGNEPPCDCPGCQARESDRRQQASHWSYRRWGFGLSYREAFTFIVFVLGGFAAIYRFIFVAFKYPSALLGMIATFLYIFVTTTEIAWNTDRLAYSLLLNGVLHALLVAKGTMWVLVARPLLIVPIGGASYAMLIGPESWSSWWRGW